MNKHKSISKGNKNKIDILLKVYQALGKKTNGEGRRLRRKLRRLGHRLSEQRRRKQ